MTHLDHPAVDSRWVGLSWTSSLDISLSGDAFRREWDPIDDGGG